MNKITPGPSAVTRRIEPDDNDLLVYLLGESGSTFVNTGSTADNDLAINGSPVKSQMGLFSDGVFFPDGGNSDRDVLWGANTVEPADLSISGWFYPARLLSEYQRLVTKEYRNDSTWSSPWQTASIGLNSSGLFWCGFTTGSADPDSIVTVWQPGIWVWHHFGFTFDSATGTAKMYIDGQLAGEETPGAALDYGTSGQWVIGGVKALGAANFNDAAHSIVHDVRIANVVRDHDYFKAAFRQGALGVSV